MPWRSQLPSCTPTLRRKRPPSRRFARRRGPSLAAWPHIACGRRSPGLASTTHAAHAGASRRSGGWRTLPSALRRRRPCGSMPTRASALRPPRRCGAAWAIAWAFRSSPRSATSAETADRQLGPSPHCQGARAPAASGQAAVHSFGDTSNAGFCSRRAASRCDPSWPPTLWSGPFGAGGVAGAPPSARARAEGRSPLPCAQCPSCMCGTRMVRAPRRPSWRSSRAWRYGGPTCVGRRRRRQAATWADRHTRYCHGGTTCRCPLLRRRCMSAPRYCQLQRGERPFTAFPCRPPVRLARDTVINPDLRLLRSRPARGPSLGVARDLCLGGLSPWAMARGRAVVPRRAPPRAGDGRPLRPGRPFFGRGRAASAG